MSSSPHTIPTPERDTLTVAQTRFDAARRIPGPGRQNQTKRHGASFVVRAQVAMKPEESPYEGGQADALHQTLKDSVADLHNGDLNDVLVAADDISLARLVHTRLSFQDIHAVTLQSTPDRGVIFRPSTDGIQTWRRMRFRAAHQLPNVPPGHPCGRLHGHGFQVVLHAQDSQPVDYETLEHIWAPYAAQLDFHCLNDIEGLSNPTSEMLAQWLWQHIKPEFSPLTHISVFETGSCGSQFDGEQFQIWKDFSVDSAIRMDQAPAGHPRRMIHGDTFNTTLYLRADLDTVMGWTVDYGDVKRAFEPTFRAMDHQPLHEQSDLVQCDAQSIAHWALLAAQTDLPELVRVDVIDSTGAGAVVFHGRLASPLPAPHI